MSPKQQTDLQNWLKNQDQELPSSLDNLFIEDCLKELNNKPTIDRFNFIAEDKNDYILAYCPDPIYEEKNGEQYDSNYKFVIFYYDYDYDSYCPPYRKYTDNHDNYCTWEKFYWTEMTSFIQTLLSRTPEGAVMPFLNVETNYWQQCRELDLKSFDVRMEIREYRNIPQNLRKLENLYNEFNKARVAPQTLDHLLYREFTEALRVGKTFDEALKIINKIYILNRYV